MDLNGVDSLVAAAFGALGVIFVGAFVGLVVICRKQHQRKRWSRLDNRSMKKNKNEHELAMALGDIGLNNALEQIISDQQWVDDASGLIPHCLVILRTCHGLTERLATLAMGPSVKRFSNRLTDAAKRIPSRVDDVVQAMYPPLDARLLEARVAALVLAVGQLALLTQSAIGSHVEWIDECLEEMDKHLLLLRNVSQEKENSIRPEMTAFV